jgi:hypothetical protein
MYEKIVLDEMYLRLEFELKGAYSRNWWQHWRSEPELIDLLFTSCINRIGLPEPYRSWFLPVDDRTDILNAAQLEASLAQRLTYLRNTETAMIKYLYDHGTRNAITKFAILALTSGLFRREICSAMERSGNNRRGDGRDHMESGDGRYR